MGGLQKKGGIWEGSGIMNLKNLVFCNIPNFKDQYGIWDKEFLGKPGFFWFHYTLWETNELYRV